MLFNKKWRISAGFGVVLASAGAIFGGLVWCVKLFL